MQNYKSNELRSICSKQTSLSPEKTSPVIIAMIAVGPIVTSFVLKDKKSIGTWNKD